MQPGNYSYPSSLDRYQFRIEMHVLPTPSSSDTAIRNYTHLATSTGAKPPIHPRIYKPIMFGGHQGLAGRAVIAEHFLSRLLDSVRLP
jgi:hypothetical protein